MLTPQEAYSSAILSACDAHLARVKAARDARVLTVSTAKNFGEHDPRTYTARSAAVAQAKEAYENAKGRSENNASEAVALPRSEQRQVVLDQTVHAAQAVNER